MKQCCESFRQVICCDSDPLHPTPYKFNFNGANITEENEKLFQSNYVRTSKYTPISFFPKALILQFRRLANCYFLLIAILQTIPQITPLNPATAWAPLIVVLAISMLRQGYQDFQRIKSDRETNYGTMTKVMRNGKFVEINWSKVVIGDIVMTEAEDMFPADLILIASSGQGGAAFIETASLDGEKNLKLKSAFKALVPFNTEEKLTQLKGVFQTSNPDKQLHKFSAFMNVQGFQEPFQINGVKQFLYRGTRLKNTKWIYGLVVFTGRNTKIIMNSKAEANKMSQIQIKVNSILVGILCIQVILSIVCAIAYSVFRRWYELDYTYINWASQGVPLDSFLMFLAYFVLLNTMIPISLIVSIQIVKFFQMIFIQKDKLLYSDYRKKGVLVKSASLNEELGQIQYIFSDKTGTLTMNIMQFKIAVVETQMFGDTSLIALNRHQLRKQEDKKEKFSGFKDDQLRRLLQTGAEDRRLDQPIIIHSSQGGNEIKLNTLRDVAIEYIKCLGLAHQVMPDKDKQDRKIYLGPSPDEITLVDGARAMGYQFMRSTQADTVINIFGTDTSYELLQLFEFNSDRKRMSVVLRDNGMIKMYMKGADSIVLKRISKDNKLKLDKELERFSLIGLRTLLIAMKTISESQYKAFKAERSKLIGMAPAEKQKAENALIDKLEENMFVIGATAVLDRLQDEVPQTIRDLLRANIKIWMLTGDKMETAQNIAKSCNLIQSDFEVIKYKPQKDATEEMIITKLKQLVEHSNKLKQQQRPKGLIIDGNDLTPILKSEAASIQLANMAKNCEAVVCCRLLPSQKAEVVRLVRKHLNKITLAIGDGANDVPMIKEAHIGVGLFGQQGMGAVQASDYALPQFRMLWRVLLVHGRWNYIRISQMILYFFYKNMLFTLPQFYISFFCGWSAQTVFDDWYIALYNLIFTSSPLVIRAVLEQDVNYIVKFNRKKQDDEVASTLKTLVKQEQKLPDNYRTNKYLYRLFPKIYFIGQQNCIFNIRNYIAWMFEALVQSVAIFFFNFYIISHLSVNSTGINGDYWMTGITIYSSVILVVTFKLATHTKFWSMILFTTFIFTSLVPYVAYMWLSNYRITENVEGTAYVAWTSAKCYFTVLFCTCMVLFIDGMVVFTDFQRGGYTSRMRKVIKEEKIHHKENYDAYSLTITDNVTTNTQKILRRDYEAQRSQSRINSPKKK